MGSEEPAGGWQAALRSGYDATAHCNPSQPDDGKARFQNLDVFDLWIHLRRSGRITGGRDPSGDALGGHPDELDLPGMRAPEGGFPDGHIVFHYVPSPPL